MIYTLIAWLAVLICLIGIIFGSIYAIFPTKRGKAKKILKIFSIALGVVVIIFFSFKLYLKYFHGVGEGEKIEDSSTSLFSFSIGKECKPGLKAVFNAQNAGGKLGCVYPMCDCYVCTKCGDGICGKGENSCNCKEDCKNNEGAPEVHKISSIEDCLNLKKDENKIFNPVAYSSDPEEQKKIDEIQNAPESDSCIFNFVDKHEEIRDKAVCDKIQSNYYKYLCRQRIAFHLKDISLCNLEFLGEQSNVDGCLNILSKSGR
jgi:hypothetical protein